MNEDPTPGQLNEIKSEILTLIKAYENGISEAELSKTMSSTLGSTRMMAINSLANEGKVQLCKRGSDLIFRAIDANSSDDFSPQQGHSDLSYEERLVLEAVRGAGNKGIWNREIRNQTKISLNQMSKVLKNLETRKIIKAVKSVTASKKKLYMLYGLEPDKSVTGGAWYTGTEFESEYVQLLQDFCYKFVKSKMDPRKDYDTGRDEGLVSLDEVKEKVDKSEISNVKLTQQDIQMIMETIVFDGLIEKIKVEKKTSNGAPRLIPAKMVDEPSSQVRSEKNLTPDEEDIESGNYTYYYRALTPATEPSGVIRTPCGQCPYTFECSARRGAVINAESCLYLERWFLT